MKFTLIVFSFVLICQNQIFAAPKMIKQRILIAVDGFSYNALRAAQANGLFTEFTKGGAHIAPFPSMTDLSWAKIMKTTQLFGQAGRLRSVEAVYFDDSTQSVIGDPRDYYQRLAFPKYYMGAFQTYFNPYLESLVYFQTEEIPKMEFKNIIDELISKSPAPLWTAYIGSIDSIAHTQKNQLYPVLKILDSEIKRLISELKQKNIQAEIILLSDHGNRGNFNEGTTDESELKPYLIADIIKKSGLNFVQKIETDKDIAIPLLALGSWAPIYVKNRNNKNQLIQIFRGTEGFDSITYVQKRTPHYIDVDFLTTTESASIRYHYQEKKYYYYPQIGNPLKIPSEFQSHTTRTIGLTDDQVLKLTFQSEYPDSLYRLIDAASNEDFDYPDLILNLQDGYYVQGPVASPVKMYRTHGSLSKNSSLGIFVSNTAELPGTVRSKDVLHFLQIHPAYLFGKTYEIHHQKPGHAYDQIRLNRTRGVETEANNYSTDRLFRIMTRFISDTRSYFVIDEIEQILKAFKNNPFNSENKSTNLLQNFDLSGFDLTKLIDTDDIGKLTDAMIQSGDLEKLKKDSRVIEIQEKIEEKLGTKHQAKTDSNLIDSITKFVLPGKRITMKMYQMPFLLDSALTLQELPTIPETRSIEFAQRWLTYRPQMIQNQDSMVRKYSDDSMVNNEDINYEIPNSWISRLFQEIFKENKLAEKIYPTQLNRIYNKQQSKNTTIVYVPGIYNSIFDKEIFSLGVTALKEELGLRVITAPTWSTCSTNVNGKILLDFLKNDQNMRQQKGFEKPNYILLGYSKGGIDSLAAMTFDPEFSSKNILAFVAIASPLKGSSILDKTDLPFELVSLLVEKNGPEICKTSEKAGPSVTPSAMQKFWRKNERNLIGLTRYFSVSFVSTPENSHLFMRATKAIAQFNEVNDGVVTLSSSKFPENIAAIDLGVIEADHIAGILSSKFQQKSFFKAMIDTLAELDISNQKNNFKINSQIILKWNKTIKDRTFISIDDGEQDGKYIVKKTMALHKNSILPTRSESIIDDSADLNQLLIPRLTDPASLYETKVKLPQNQLQYDPYQALDVSKLGQIMQSVRVSPLNTSLFKEGVNIEFNHQSTIHFRMDHQMNWESRTPTGMDDNPNSGWFVTDYGGEKNWAVLRSKKNSIRLTTMAYRFKPTEFPNFALKTAITKGVKGADPVKGKTGIDDSAIQVWLSVREKNMTGDRTTIDPKKDKIILFGYYWGDPAPGENRRPGDIFENWYSNKNVIVATLPEAKMLLLNSQDQLGKIQIFQRNIKNDLQQAFPDRNVNEMEIVAITIQHDSNDAKDESEAYFKYLKFTP